MIRNVSVTLAVAAMALTLAGCTGGESVEDQERFQLDRSPAEAAGNEIRMFVDSLNEAMEGEGMDSLQYAVQSSAEGMDAVDLSRLEGDAKDKAEQIKQLMNELSTKVSSGASEAEVQEILQQMTDLANQLPGGDSGAAAE